MGGDKNGGWGEDSIAYRCAKTLISWMHLEGNELQDSWANMEGVENEITG